MSEFRKKTEPPTEVGWYYGRPHSAHQLSRDDMGYPIRPVFVGATSMGAPFVFVAGQEHSSRFDQFDWFGPVMEVKEG